MTVYVHHDQVPAFTYSPQSMCEPVASWQGGEPTSHLIFLHPTTQKACITDCQLYGMHCAKIFAINHMLVCNPGHLQVLPMPMQPG